MQYFARVGRRLDRKPSRAKRIRQSCGRERAAFETLEQRLLLSATPGVRGLSPAWFADVPHIAAAAAAPSAVGESSFVGPIAPSRWIVQLTPEATSAAATPAGAAAMLVAAGLPIQALDGLGAEGLVSITVSRTSDDAAAKLAAHELVEHFEPVRTVTLLGGEPGIVFPNDPLFAQQWNLHNDGSSGGRPDADIDAPEAWGIRTNSSDVVVAVIDSGIDYSHPDLAANMWTNSREIAGNGVDDDQNGFIDDYYGYNFVGGPANPNPIDDVGHGTLVAGVIGAVGDNGVGISGVAWSAKLMALKFIASSTTTGGAGTQDHAIQAIDYATMMRTQFGVNIRVINASWGLGGAEDPFLKAAIRRAGDAGILFVAGAGNGDTLFRGLNIDEFPFYPASTDLDNVVAVAASDDGDALARFSNFGPVSVDLMAPGVGVYSTRRGGGYDINNGTSVAAPHVSGVAALIFSELLASTPDATPLEVKEAILSGADSLVEWQSRIAAGRRLNAFGALAVDKVRPRAALVSAPNITTEDLGSESQTIVVRYTDNRSIDTSMFDDDDVIVRRRFDGTAFPTTITGYQPLSDGAPGYEVVYEMTAPGGTWEPLDNAPHYDVIVQAGQILDAESNYVNGLAIGAFEVRIESDGIFPVNSADDTMDINPGDGRAEDAAGNTSLRAAVMEANALPLDNVYILLPAGEYRLTRMGTDEDGAATGDLDVSRAHSGPFTPTLTILGGVPVEGYPEGPVIEADGLDRVWDVFPGNNMHLENVTLRGGDAGTSDGGGIRNAGKLTLVDTTVEGNRAANGGGIYSNGVVILTNSTIENNSADGDGGGVYNTDHASDDQPTLEVRGSTIAGNTAENGGGIYHADRQDSAAVIVGPMIVTNSTISGNRARQRGGGMYTTNTARGSIDNSTITANEAAGVAAADDLVGWWRGEDNAVDESGVAGPASLHGAVSYRPGLFGGKAFHFEGTPDTRVEIPGTAAMQHQQLTVQAWVRAEGLAPASTDAYGGVVFAKDNGVSTMGTGSTLLVTGPGTNGNFYFQLQWRRGADVRVTPPLLSYFAWAPTVFHHVAVTWDGRTARFYIDGKQAYFRYDINNDGTPDDFVSIVIPENFDSDPTNDWFLDYDPEVPLTIGDHSPGFIGDPRPFLGLIDEAAVFSRALTADEVLSTYELGLPYYLDAGGGVYRSRKDQDLIGWWRGGTNANDSAANHHGTMLGDVSPSAGYDGSANSAFDFAGAPNNRVEVPFSPDFVVEKFSVDAWVRADSAEVGDEDGRGNVIVSLNNTPGNTFRISGPGEDGRFTFAVSLSNGVFSGEGSFRTSSAFAFGAWHHVAMTWDGKQVLGYVDGNELVRAEIPENIDANPDNDLRLDLAPLWPLTFGGLRVSPGGLMDGRIDEAALYGRVLSSDEIRAIYEGDDAVKSQARLGALSLTNSIVAANTGVGSPDAAGQFVSLGYNLIGNAGSATGFGAMGDLVGRNGAATIDPRLSALASNGGRTTTHAVLSGSPAIDAASNAVATPFDQRGVARPQDADGDGTATADIGAVERFYGTIGGRIFADQDQDGMAGPSEAGVGAWNVFLEQQVDGAWTVVGQHLTDAAGEYTFANVTPGAYRVRVEAQASWLPTTPSTGEQSIDLAPGAIEDAADFGFFASLGEIRGRVFHDLDQNGIDDLDREGPGDSREPGLAGRVVFLDLNRNEQLDNSSPMCEPSDDPADEPCVITGDDGAFAFTDLEPRRTYVVRQAPVAGWPLTAPPPVSPPHPEAGDRVYVIEMAAGVRHVDVSFGSYPSGVLAYNVSGQLFDDANGDGKYTIGEMGFVGWTVYVDSNDNGVLDAGEVSTVTRADDPNTAGIDEAGVYSFASPPGFRVVRVANESLARQTTPLQNEMRFGTPLPNNGNLQAIIAADLDGDSVVDLAAVDANKNEVVIFHNDGQGTFSTSLTEDRYRVGILPDSIVAGDFLDADGDMDLIVTNSNTASIAAISILRNLGAGRFEVLPANAGPTLPSSPVPIPDAIAAIDYDQDNDLDVAVVDSNLRQVYLFRNNGNGTFGRAHTLTGLGENPIAIVSGDFNDDGRQDLAVAAYGKGVNPSDPDAEGTQSKVTVLLNAGNGSFTVQDLTGHGNGANALTVSDLDGDGDDDIVVVNLKADNGRVLWNDGAGRFSVAAEPFATGAGPTSIVAQDMDADGDDDLLVANASTQKVALLRNEGSGRFSLPEVFGILSYSQAVFVSLAPGDFNDDGVADVALAHGAQGVLDVIESSLVSGGHRIVLNDNVSGVDFAFRSTSTPPPAAVVGRRVFYGNSAFDNGQGGANSAAIATDKSALLPGETAGFDNYTSYSRGINGIVVDIRDLPTTALTAADFEFGAGTTGDPAAWPTLAGTVSVAAGAGVSGSDRVTIRFADNSVRSKWLRIVVKANANTGLTTDDVHYWGNAPGETGDSPTDTRVDYVDVARIRQNTTSTAAVANRYDINRDGVVNVADAELVRNSFLNSLFGDRDRDDIVGLGDVAVVQSRLSVVGRANNYAGDINDDGVVNLADVAILSGEFGRRATPGMIDSRLTLLAAPATSISIAAPAAIVVRVEPNRNSPATDPVLRHTVLAISQRERARGERDASLPPIAAGNGPTGDTALAADVSLRARRLRGHGQRAMTRPVTELADAIFASVQSFVE